MPPAHGLGRNLPAHRSCQHGLSPGPGPVFPQRAGPSPWLGANRRPAGSPSQPPAGSPTHRYGLREGRQWRQALRQDGHVAGAGGGAAHALGCGHGVHQRAQHHALLAALRVRVHGGALATVERAVRCGEGGTEAGISVGTPHVPPRHSAGDTCVGSGMDARRAPSSCETKTGCAPRSRQDGLGVVSHDRRPAARGPCATRRWPWPPPPCLMPRGGAGLTAGHHGCRGPSQPSQAGRPWAVRVKSKRKDPSEVALLVHTSRS